MEDLHQTASPASIARNRGTLIKRGVHWDVLIMKLQVVLGHRELDPDSSFTFIDGLSNLHTIANFTQPLVRGSSFI